MASLKLIRVVMTLFYTFITVITIVSVNGQPSSYSSGNYVEKVDHPTTFIQDEGSSQFSGRPSFSNCGGMDSQALDLQREVRSNTIKIPFSQHDNSRFMDYRYYLPVGSLRSKKVAKAILLDVGDYITKTNGSPMVAETPVPLAARPPPGIQIVGGLMRTSGK